MNKSICILLNVALALASSGVVCACSDASEDGSAPAVSTKRERNSIKDGNELYEQKRYAEAEVAYKKALEENPDNAVAQFNLASSYLKQRGEDLANKGDSLVRTADGMLARLAEAPELAEPSFYDRGNVAYKGEDYASAIEMYKNALRRNPENNQARENLRLAQLKKQEQDQQNQDQDKDENKDQDQDKDQNQDITRTKIRIRIRIRTKIRIKTRMNRRISRTSRTSKTRKRRNRSSNKEVSAMQAPSRS